MPDQSSGEETTETAQLSTSRKIRCTLMWLVPLVVVIVIVVLVLSELLSPKMGAPYINIIPNL